MAGYAAVSVDLSYALVEKIFVGNLPNELWVKCQQSRRREGAAYGK